MNATILSLLTKRVDLRGAVVQALHDDMNDAYSDSDVTHDEFKALCELLGALRALNESE